jgi:prepilin-type N-terminal cleavage/methylation domain-containing protein
MTRLRSEAGFTLTELLVAMVIGMFTILSAFALLDATTEGTARVTGRTDANQRGRHALDVITRSLRSQVCVNGVPPILAADVNEVTFTADLSATGASDQRRITFSPTARTISLGVKAGAGTEPARTFPGAFTTQQLLADVVADGATPFFSYWANVPGTGGSQQQQLTTLPLPANDLRRVARIDITFVARPTRATTTRAWASALEDSITVRAVDADSANPTVECQ